MKSIWDDDEEEQKKKDLAFDHLLAEEILRVPQADQDEIKEQRASGLRASPRGRQIFPRKKRSQLYRELIGKKTMDKNKKLVDLRKKPPKAKVLPLRSRVVDEDLAMSEAPPYPPGFRISLENEGLARLNLDTGSFHVGDQINFSAMGEIVSVSEDKFDDGRINQRVEIQIIKTDLGQ